MKSIKGSIFLKEVVSFNLTINVNTMEPEAKSESSELSIDIERFIEANELELTEVDKENTDAGYEPLEIDEIEGRTNLIFVDIQGFQSRDSTFICKEFCLVSGDDVYHAVIKSPFPFGRLPGVFRNQAKYTARHIHGLTWDCGDVHWLDVLQTAYMKTLGKIVVVKGDQKVKWLRYLFRNCGEINCVNMEDWGYCKSVHLSTEMHEICNYHYHNYSIKWRCAKEQALKLQEIVTKYELYDQYF